MDAGLKRFAQMLRNVMNKPKSTWSVVATVHEPPAVVQVFVAWYLHLGASRITLYFDAPDDPAADMVASTPGVRVIRCDSAHWRSLGRARPSRHQIRQAKNAMHAYQCMDAAWLLHVDADEYLCPTNSVSACFNRIDATIQCVVVPVAERVNLAFDADTIFGGGFRRPYRGKRQDGRDLFGPDYDLTLCGLTGHTLGKSFVRGGEPLQMSIHRPKAADPDGLIAQTVGDLELLHFDGLTRLQWIYKLLRKADAVAHHNGMPPSPHRQRQIDAVLEGPKAALALYDRVKHAPPELVGQLRAQGLWRDRTFDPRGALARVLPDVSVDLSAAAVDAWLWGQNAELLRGFGLRLGG